jgi:undecaprenyl-diphosphatase
MSCAKMRSGDSRARGIWLVAALSSLIVIGVALRAVATLACSQDLALVKSLAGDRTSLLTALAHGVSVLGRSYVLVPCAAVIAVVAAARGRRLQGLVLLVGVVGAVIIQNVDKAIVGRPRPPVTRLEHVSSTSFPSGHATESTAFFVLILLAVSCGSGSRALKLAAMLATVVIVAGVGLSRVYLGVHYPTDVAAGILLGGAWSAACAAILLDRKADS